MHARHGRLAPAPVAAPGVGDGREWRLTTEERKRILLTHIHGVDIDPQAVEVTKLSLLLKVLEEEYRPEQMTFLERERALPDLEQNIRCGNSLIGPDYYAGRQLTLFNEEEMYRVNAFDWREGFGRAMAAGGFDAVIGNPPYIRIQAMKRWAPQEVEFYKEEYVAAGKGNYDIYVVFVEKGLSLLRREGLLGYILPHKFFNAKYGEPLRGLIAEGRHLAEIIHFGDHQVFDHATTYTCLLFLAGAGRDSFHIEKVEDLQMWRSNGGAVRGGVKNSKVSSEDWNFVVGPWAPIFERLSAMPITLGDLAHIFVGTQTSADRVFVLEDCELQGDVVLGICEETGRRVRVERKITKPFLRGKDIRRYEPLSTSARLICPYRIGTNDFSLMEEKQLETDYSLAYGYLRSHKATLSEREGGRFKGADWFAFGYPKSMTLFQQPKVVVPDYNNVASFTYDNAGHFYKTGYGVILGEERRESPFYVLGLLNAKLLFKFLLEVSTTLRGGYVRFWTQFVEQLPIRTVNFDDPADVARHQHMVSLVECMLQLHERLAGAKTPQAKRLLEQQIEMTDREIDRLVYELYGLSEDEIAIVEEGRSS
jgi:hypothetical protein